MGSKKYGRVIYYGHDSPTPRICIKEEALDTPGRNGQKHNDNKMRRLQIDCIHEKECTPAQQKRLGKGWIDQYLENWDILI
ncbi:hypothetical protein COU75_04350 [Candidatus Peregrinibacteria bacterium CG10_big_fil_rev_8_21_14_0_10_42_8]|nr:MAG: hypothetical protein COU75_04350 [Candidatus Peregrinibacteria bacterium CG10_big_fil_rev_8_21_14_0_10_42_8]